MDLKVNKEEKNLTLEVIGRLDTNTAPELEQKMEEIFKDTSLEKIVFDFSQLEYVSSAGLRVILGTSKKTTSSGIDFRIKNVNDEVMEVFEITGFLDLLNIEN